MKKSVLLLTMISSMALVGCDVNQLKNKDGDQVIVRLNDGTEYTANDLFENYSKTSAGAAEYYSAVYNVLIRAVQEKNNAIENEVYEKMNSFIDSVKSTASTNGSTYKTALSDALAAKKLESLEELEQVYYLESQKSAYEEAYYDDNLNDSLLEEYIKYYAPYHIRHILVKNSGSSSLYNSAISEEDATNLVDVVRRLASGRETFGVIAKSTASNGDSGSAEIYGDVGIMDTNTSFVSEFKYGVYTYDALFGDTATKDRINQFNEAQATRTIGANSSANKADITGASLLAINQDQKDVLRSNVGFIDYAVFENLDQVKKIEKDGQGLQVNDGQEKYYPRNYLYNRYLNKHGLNFIVKGNSSTAPESTRWVLRTDITGSTEDASKILCDETGNPILVTKAGTGAGDSGYQGIHFIVIQKSAFAETVDDLKAYYDSTVPTSSDDVSDMDTYVTFIKSDRSTYSSRSSKIKDAVKSFDSYLSYRIYEKALDQATDPNGTIKATVNEDIDSIISSYMKANRESTAYTKKEAYEDSWKSFINLLTMQNTMSSHIVTRGEILNAYHNPTDWTLYGDVR